MSPRWVLGLAGSHNGAAALYRDDELVAAVQEERLTRRKRAVLECGRASRAVEALLADQGLTPDAIELVVAAPLVDPEAPAQRVDAHPLLGGRTRRPPIVVSHHHAHALSAFACSGFAEACALVVDGMGSHLRDVSAAERAVVIGAVADALDREHATIYDVDRGALRPLEKHVAHNRSTDEPTWLGPFASLGLAYQQIARATFGQWDAAGKVMGLAPYGRAVFPRAAFFAIGADGGFTFNDGADGIAALVPRPGRYPEDAALHADLAASVQAAIEDGLLHLVRRARARSASRRLVCAGGVFLNSVANERIVRSGLFDEVFFVPFAEDSGTAVGAAFHGVVSLFGPTAGRRLVADSLGPRHAPPDGPPISADAIAQRLERGEAVGLFAGRSELGPRALGQRSILYDPRRPEGARELNQRKGRELFRPFAPAVLARHAADWFELEGDSPFMLRVAAVRPERRARIPAVTHVDGSARVQTVDGGPLAPVIEAFFARTGVPLVLNTSFNAAGEPIVETPADALDAARRMRLDALVIEGRLMVI